MKPENGDKEFTTGGNNTGICTRHLARKMGLRIFSSEPFTLSTSMIYEKSKSKFIEVKRIFIHNIWHAIRVKRLATRAVSVPAP